MYDVKFKTHIRKKNKRALTSSFERQLGNE